MEVWEDEAILGDQLEALFLNDHSSSLPLQSSSFSDVLGLGTI